MDENNATVQTSSIKHNYCCHYYEMKFGKRMIADMNRNQCRCGIITFIIFTYRSQYHVYQNYFLRKNNINNSITDCQKPIKLKQFVTDRDGKQGTIDNG